MARGEEEGAEAGMRRGGAAGMGAARTRGAVEAVRPRTAARKERDAAPRNAIARVSSEKMGTAVVAWWGIRNGEV